MARAGLDLDGVVSFHGSVDTAIPARPGIVKARVLVLNGADDKFITEEQITRVKEEMTAAGVDYKFINYPGARHSFTNPEADRFAKQFNMPIAYNAEADKQSWQEMRKFFDKLFK